MKIKETGSVNSNNISGNNKKYSIEKVLLVLAIVFFISLVLVRNFYFIKQDYGPKDSDNQYVRSLYYYRNLVFNEKADIRSVFYPPVCYLNALMFYKILGPTVESSRLSILLFMIIFLLALFGIGNEMNGPLTGFVLMALGASSVHILNFSVKYFLDFPCTAMVAASIYFLIKTDFYRDKKFTLIFGFVFAVALLTKNFVVFYMTLPVLWFLFPNIFKSKRSFFITLILFIPVVIMLGGSLWFIFQIKNTPMNSTVEQKWLLFYLLFILLPAVLLSIIAFFTGKKFGDNKDEDAAAISGLVNFSYAFSIFTTLSLPWYYWAARANVFYFFLQKSDQVMFAQAQSFSQRFIEALLVYLEFIINSFNFAPLLFVVGIVFFFIKKENAYRNLVFPVGLVFSSLVMLTTLHFHVRYLLPLTVFFVIVSGYWIGFTGKIKEYISFFLIVISIFSIITWVPLTPIKGIFTPELLTFTEGDNIHFGILYPKKPNPAKVNTDDIVDHLVSNCKKNRIGVIFYHYTDKQLEYMYYFQGEAMKRGLNLFVLDYWKHDGAYNPLNRDKFSREEIEGLSENVQYVLAIHKKNQDSDAGKKAFEKVIPDAVFKEKIIPVGSGEYFLTISRVVKD